MSRYNQYCYTYNIISLLMKYSAQSIIGSIIHIIHIIGTIKMYYKDISYLNLLDTLK